MYLKSIFVSSWLDGKKPMTCQQITEEGYQVMNTILDPNVHSYSKQKLKGFVLTNLKKCLGVSKLKQILSFPNYKIPENDKKQKYTLCYI